MVGEGEVEGEGEGEGEYHSSDILVACCVVLEVAREGVSDRPASTNADGDYGRT